MSLKRRLEASQTVTNVLAAGVGSYLRLCDRTTRWQTEGMEELRMALQDGPVVMVLWHSRAIFGYFHWPLQYGPLSSPYDASPVGRVSGALQKRNGLQAMEMSDSESNRSASLKILRRAKAGVSIGLTGDGPLGPPRQVKDAPLEWARITGLPVFAYAFATTRGTRLQSWDKMLFPKPFGKGAKVYARLDTPFARRPDAETREAERQALTSLLNRTAARADALCGLPEGP